ncbi:Topoisomerase 1-associated factor 1 [Tilletia horrida]|uniref:Topoisomerase 1-associated factor 1 n=1 Tax=Tilletia horrida TaxID=155126 RepID=A0AAN6GXZ9_9BASI|nr:Topoisomerase 1-associated factor 1 [Tilletia horrida]KAK0557578.1 Topoisomerase 1-associated factor 1 [Tilletia horrida]
MAELDYVDDLDLLEDYDLAEGASDMSSSEEAGRGRVDPEEHDLPSDYDEEAENRELMNIVIGLCSALGGYEEMETPDGKKETVYRPGDDCLGCLRDLRKLWKHDDEDLARNVARAYSKVNVLHNDLVPIVLTCAGTGERGDKLALAATDLITALTWPLDVLDELRDALEKEFDKTKLSALPQLQRAQVDYKASIMRVRGGPAGTGERDFLSTVMNFVLLPSLSKPRGNRTERDLGTINMVLHLFRNLLAIRDPVATSLSSSELVELSTLQSKLVLAMDRSNVLDTLLMLASSATRREYEDYNAITAECIYHLIVGTSPKRLLAGEVPKRKPSADGQAQQTRPVEAPKLSDENKAALLTSLLTEASKKRANVIATGSSRHSRFGTTISFVGSDGNRGVARQASSLRKSIEELEAEQKARTKRRRGRTRLLNEKGAPGYRQDWSKRARKVVIRWSDEFVKHGLETLSRTLIEDLRREREKLGDLDVARIHFMQLATFYLEYFLIRRSASPSTKLWDPNAPEQTEQPQKPTEPEDQEANGETTSVTGTDAEGQKAGEGEPEQAGGEASQSQKVDKNLGANGQSPRQPSAEPQPAEQPAAPQETTPESAKPIPDPNAEEWPMSTVGFFSDKWPFVLVYRRSKEALQDKNWLELATCARLWIIMLKLIEAQEQSIDEEERNGAEWVQATVHSDNDVHDTARAMTICYKRQTFAFLETLIQFSHAYPRSLERHMKGRDSMMVKAKTRVRKQMRQDGEHAADDDDEVEKRAHNMVEDVYKERVFTFNAFQDKLSSRYLADTCLAYVLRWQDFSNPQEQLDTVVRVMHRIAIKANGRRMFYQAHQRAGFKRLKEHMIVLEAIAPKAADNLKQLIKVVQRSFEKLTPEEKAKYAEGQRAPRQLKTAAPPKDIVVKPGHSVDEQVGIAVGLLLEKELMSHVNWVKGALEHASEQRKKVILDVDGADALDPDEDGDIRRPSMTAMSKFDPYELPFEEGEEKLKRDAASLPALKLLCRLVGLDAREDECIWSVPAINLPEHLDSDVAAIEKYIRSPFDTNGEQYSTFVQNVRKQRERKLAEPRPPENLDGFLATDSSSESESDGEFQANKRRKGQAGDSDKSDEEAFGSSAADTDDDEATKNQRALKRLLAKKQKKAERKEKEKAKAEERAKKRKLKKKVFRPGDDGARSAGQTGVARKRRFKPAAVPMFQGLEAALDDVIEDSDEEMADLDREIARQAALSGANAGDDSSSETGGVRRARSISPAASLFLGDEGENSSPPTSPLRNRSIDSESPETLRFTDKASKSTARKQVPSSTNRRRRQTTTVIRSPSNSPPASPIIRNRSNLVPAAPVSGEVATEPLSPLSRAIAASNSFKRNIAALATSPLSQAVAASRTGRSAAASGSGFGNSAMASPTRSGPADSSPNSSPLSRVVGSSRPKQAQHQKDAAARFSSPGLLSSQPASSGSDAIMSRWKAFAKKSTRQEPKSLFIFSDNEDEMDELDELAEDGQGSGAPSSSAFRKAADLAKSKSRGGKTAAKASRTRVPLAVRNIVEDEEDDELVDELDDNIGKPVAPPVGMKARGMQGRAGASVDVGTKRKRAILSDDDS